MKQIMRYYYEDKERVLQSLDSCGQGLSDAEAAARLERNGRNKLKEAKKESLLSRFFNQFLSRRQLFPALFRLLKRKVFRTR